MSGKSIARAILGALGGSASSYGDIAKQQMLSSDDLYNALAKLQMGESLSRTNPKNLAEIAALQQEMELAKHRDARAAAAEGRLASEYQRGLDLEQRAADMETARAKQAVEAYNIGSQAASDRVANAIQDEQAARTYPDKIGWFDALRAASSEGRMGGLDYITSPGKMAVGALFGQRPVDAFGTPQTALDAIEAAKQRTNLAVERADAAYRKPALVRDVIAAGGPEQFGISSVDDARMMQRFPQMSTTLREQARQDLARQGLSLKAADIERKRAYGEENLALKLRQIQNTEASTALKAGIAQTKLMNDVQKTVLIHVLNGDMTVDDAEAQIPGVKAVLAELMSNF